MEPQSQWSHDFIRELGMLAEMLDPREAKRYRLGLLRDVALRLDETVATCADCQLQRQELSDGLTALRNAVTSDGQVTDKARRKDFQKQTAAVLKHLEKGHRLVPPGHYQGILLALGPALGVAIGTALDNVAIGIAIGTGLGLAAGSLLDARARREGRVIGEAETIDRGLTSPNKIKFLIIGGVLLAVVALIALLSRSGLF